MQFSLTPALLLASPLLATAWTIPSFSRASHSLLFEPPVCFGFFPPFPPESFWRPAPISDCHAAWNDIKDHFGPPCSLRGERKGDYFFLKTVGGCSLAIAPEISGDPSCIPFPFIRDTVEAIFSECRQGEAGGVILGQGRIGDIPARVIVGNNPVLRGERVLGMDEGEAWAEKFGTYTVAKKQKGLKWWL